ncbi:MAG: hypothetical protein GXP16_01815 [Gammaproteobacteria bacterium]|nr:hypothetical protein [Gammaproteobacteria bacterium]
MSRQFLVLVTSIFIGTSSFAETQTIDITAHLIEMMQCNAKHYLPPDQGFDIEKFNESWSACAKTRDNLLEALPESKRDEWRVKLEYVRSSMIDKFQPQPSQAGHGLNPENPVAVGGIEDGPKRTYAYFSRLRTKDGRSVQVRRVGSCCRFRTPNASIGDHAVLDKYELSADQFKTKITVYVNIYDEGEMHAISGFTLEDEA